jgi:hypothetical protein
MNHPKIRGFFYRKWNQPILEEIELLKKNQIIILDIQNKIIDTLSEILEAVTVKPEKVQDQGIKEENIKEGIVKGNAVSLTEPTEMFTVSGQDSSRLVSETTVESSEESKGGEFAKPTDQTENIGLNRPDAPLQIPKKRGRPKKLIEEKKIEEQENGSAVE